MDVSLIVGGIAVVGLLAWFLSQWRFGPGDDAVKARFEKVPNFRITEAHAHEGTGMAADEAANRLLILAKDRPQLVLCSIKDLVGWHYLPKGDGFEMEIRTRRHKEPLLVSFGSRSQADLWIKILTLMAKRR
jgi:hypothetical protein